MNHELTHLLTDPAHWQFELISTIVFDLLTFLVILPVIGAWKRHHRSDHKELDMIKRRLTDLEKTNG